MAKMDVSEPMTFEGLSEAVAFSADGVHGHITVEELKNALASIEPSSTPGGFVLTVPTYQSIKVTLSSADLENMKLRLATGNRV